MTDRTVVYRIQADVTQARANVAAFGASVKKLGDDATKADKQGQAFRSGLDTLGGAAGKAGLVAAVGLGAAVKKAADFDSAMSNVQAATHETSAAMDDLRRAALDAGQDTAFSATEAAAGIENLAKAGVSTAEILDGGLNGALALAAAGQMEVADAAEAAAGAMAQFGLAGDQVPRIADLLSAAAGKAQGDVSDFTMALKQGGTVAAQTGLTLEETTGALAAMAEQSLLGSDAGTSFKTMLSSLTPNSKKAADAMEQYNINAFDAQGNFVGMTELAGQLERGLGGLTNEQRAMTLETIFGSDAVRAASIIYDNGAAGIADWTDKVNDAGFAAETAAIKQDNLRGDLEKLGGALETALIGTGSGSQGPLRSLTQSLESAVNAYNDLGSGAKSGVAVMLGATATIGGGLFVFSKTVQSIAATREALEAVAPAGSKAAGALDKAGRAAGIAAGLFAGLAVIDAAQGGLKDYTIGIEEMTGSILELGNTPAELPANLDGLADSVERLANPNYAQGLQDNIAGVIGFGGGSELAESTAQVEALDGALSSLVSEAGPEAAAAQFEALAEATGMSAGQQKELLSLLPGYKEALAGVENQAAMTSGSAAELGSEAAALGDVMTVAERQAQSFKDTLEGLSGVLDQRGNVRSYEAALDDFTESIKENGKSFDITTEKGRNNQAALDGIASSALAVAEGLGRADRKKFLTSAIEDIRTMGNQMGLPKAEINALIGLLQKANKTNVKPKIDVDSVSAMSAIERIRNAMLGIKDKSVTIRVTQTGAALSPGFGPVGSADGSTVPKTGKPYADRHLYLLADGEEVISNRFGQADRHRPLLKAINGGLADGGTAGDDGKATKRKSRTRFDVTDNTKALQASIDRLTNVAANQTGAIEAQRFALEKATETTELWAGKMSDLAQATVAGFNTGLFEKDSNVWAAGSGGGAISNLTGDIAGLREREVIQAQLASMGISGDALAAMLSEGSNADLTALINSGQANYAADLIGQRAALQGTVGGSGAQAAYGQQYAQAAAAQQQQFAVLQSHLASSQRIEAQIGSLVAAQSRTERQIADLNKTGPERSGFVLGKVLNEGANKGHRDRFNKGMR